MNKINIVGMIVLFLMSIQYAYAQSPDVSVRAKYGMETKGEGMMFDGKQWVPQGKTTVEGGITLVVKLEGNITEFSTGITGTKKKGSRVIFQCKNGESFYLKVKTAHPVTNNKFKKSNKQLIELVDKFRKNKKEKLAWDIWKQVDMN
ncbi:hypothetical protein MNBD_GAMMA11-662 [hydrothermal vent metagenome]|uniref:Uncharacterized protein n=1 Tax=hydrothermal vent metagenome TaxID=652676 RepID=A0A3B0WUH2_9ZZZZ